MSRVSYQGHLCSLPQLVSLCSVGVRFACWAGWSWGQRWEASFSLTGLFFQMIESNDISGEKIRMKETVEGEWPLGRRVTGLGDRMVGSAFELGATWFCIICHC